jgi:hypothetical protein
LWDSINSWERRFKVRSKCVGFRMTCFSIDTKIRDFMFE